MRVLTGLDDPDAMLDFYLRLGRRSWCCGWGRRGLSGDRRRGSGADSGASGDGGGCDWGRRYVLRSFLARILAGDEPEAAARYANVAAALACRGYGAVGPIPTADAVWSELARASARGVVPLQTFQ